MTGYSSSGSSDKGRKYRIGKGKAGDSTTDILLKKPIKFEIIYILSLHFNTQLIKLNPAVLIILLLSKKKSGANIWYYHKKGYITLALSFLVECIAIFFRKSRDTNIDVLECP